jgi:ATP-dependent Clp protease ATP-binding subunit ClpC
VRTLLSLEPRRDSITLRIFETIGDEALSWWITTMTPLFKARSWEATCHILDDASPYPGYWPRASRRWGPPRSLEELEMLLREKANDKRSHAILLSCRGPLAGVLLALEVGVHRWILPGGGDEKPTLSITPVAMRATLAEREWSRPEVMPPAAALLEEGKRTKPLREFDVSAGKLTVQGKTYPCKPSTFVDIHDDVALDQLLRYETSDLDRDPLFTAPLDAKEEEA